MAVVKTGATWAAYKLPAHFNTTFKCLPNRAAYSDFAEDIEGERVLDAFAAVDPHLSATHPDFDLRRRLAYHGKNGLRPADASHDRDAPGARLDRWKMLPMLEAAFRHAPSSTDWFVLLEDDSFVSWRNVLRYVARLDPKRRIYAGAPMQVGETVFAHGGATILLSRAAVSAALALRRANRLHYDALARQGHPGDVALGALVADSGTSLTWAWPNFQAEDPALLDLSAENYGRPPMWCHAVLSAHHLEPWAVQAMWDAELAHIASSRGAPLHWADVFARAIQPAIMGRSGDADSATATVTAEPSAKEWDNFAGGLGGVTSGVDAGVCAVLCAQEPRCAQWRLLEEADGGFGSCHMGEAVRLGEARRTRDGERPVTSGWVAERVHKFADGLGRCHETLWALPDG